MAEMRWLTVNRGARVCSVPHSFRFATFVSAAAWCGRKKEKREKIDWSIETLRRSFNQNTLIFELSSKFNI
uniref:Uncharacterized protein n=1 Tax=Aegilops tauschii subsp. strangulata TaxID=200361 RepID=A0A453B4B5_AEGTS